MQASVSENSPSSLAYLFILRLSAAAFLHGDTEFLGAFLRRGIAAFLERRARARSRRGYFSRAPCARAFCLDPCRARSIVTNNKIQSRRRYIERPRKNSGKRPNGNSWPPRIYLARRCVSRHGRRLLAAGSAKLLINPGATVDFVALGKKSKLAQRSVAISDRIKRALRSFPRDFATLARVIRTQHLSPTIRRTEPIVRAEKRPDTVPQHLSSR